MTAEKLQLGDAFKILGKRKKFIVLNTFIIKTGPEELKGKLCIVVGCRQLIVNKEMQVVLIN